MEQNDETSGEDLKEIFNAHLLGECDLSVRSLQRAREQLGYVCRTVSYGQMIREKNIEKRYIWALETVELINKGYDFRDRIFCDESRIVKEVHALQNFVRKNQTVVKKPKPKHPYSIMIWGGISRRGKTKLLVFDGIMCAQEYSEILDEGYLPFIRSTYANEPCSLWQDNASNQTSNEELQEVDIEDETDQEIVQILNRVERSSFEHDLGQNNNTQTITLKPHVNGSKTQPILYIDSDEGSDQLSLSIPKYLFSRHQQIAIDVIKVCAGEVPTIVEAFDASKFAGEKIDEPIGIDVSALNVNLTELAATLKNDTQIDSILDKFDKKERALGGSFVRPILQHSKYDKNSPPSVFETQAVIVRIGIYIESLSNFEASTMDYEMDIYLRMAWRDPRLHHNFTKSILVKEAEILELIWRPDPFFSNAKEASFHDVTFLNFLLRIFPDGEIFYETRIRLKPSCNLVLCKFPHDKQVCELEIRSFAYTIDTVKFEWFSKKSDAITKNAAVQLPELFIASYTPEYCDGTRKTGNFSCIKAVFKLERDIGFHIAQTYVPTTLALMFSWVGVWLPDDLNEGRLGLAITVLLTLSTESAGAREHLPSVSYLKAIDIWFGYITGFVFITLLQTLLVIGFDKRARLMHKWATKKCKMSEKVRSKMMAAAKKHHKMGRFLDNFCRVAYPMAFLLFLIMYFFVFTQGRQNECIAERKV